MGRATRAQVELVDPTDPLAVEQATAAVASGLGALGNAPQLLGVLGVYPHLDEPVGQAPECNDLRRAQPTSSTGS